MLTAAVAWVEQVVVHVGYAGVLLLLFIEAFVPPIPAQWALLLGGWLVTQSRLTLVGLWTAAVVGEVGGSLVLYALARRLDDMRLVAVVRRARRWVPFLHKPDHLVLRTLHWFRRSAVLSVIVCRLLPLPPLRSVASLVAGASRMHPLVFTLSTVAGSTISTGVWIASGMALGDHWDAVLGSIQRQPLAWAVLLAGLGALLVGVAAGRAWWVGRGKKQPTSIVR